MCDSGTVCNDCITKIDKQGTQYYKLPNFGDAIDFTMNATHEEDDTMEIDPVVYIREYGTDESDRDYVGNKMSNNTELFWKSITQLVWLTRERGAPYGYGNRTSQSMPTCPCCRAEFSFFGKGYQMVQDANFRLTTARREKYFHTMVQDASSGIEKGGVCPSQQVHLNKTLMAWFNKAVVVKDGVATIPPRFRDNHEYYRSPTRGYSPAISAYASLNQLLNDHWSFDEITTDIKALQICAQLDPTCPLGKELIGLTEEHKRIHTEILNKIYDMPNQVHLFKYIQRLVDTDSGGANPLTLDLPPVNKRVNDFLDLFSGLKRIGTPTEVPSKTIPSSVDSMLTSFHKLTPKERMLLIQEMNAIV